MGRRSSNYVKLSQDEIRRAQHSDIVEFLRNQGEKVIKVGRFYTWDKHDSVRIQGYKWFQNSTDEHGAAVAFVQHFYNVHFVVAVKMLLRDNLTLPEILPVSRKGDEPVPFSLPPKNDNNRRVVAYLMKTRKIHIDVLQHFIENQLIYEDENHNAVFVGLDSKQYPVYAFKRGTNTFVDKPYKQLAAGSNVCYPFRQVGKSNRLYVMEAAIDVLSYICLHRDVDWTKENYLSLGGLHDRGLVQFLKNHGNINEIIFCTDNDIDSKNTDGTPCNHGQDFAQLQCKKYSNKYITRIQKPKGKDWNDDLCSAT